MRPLRIAVGCALAVLTISSPRAQQPSAPATPANLKIVIVEGEDAVNIVQQRTAVAPVVEVRDRNDLPVAGAVVRFAITSGRASFANGRTLLVTTNAAGRATATGLAPTGSGALQIGASVSFQGQTAAITIAQTNVLTAAQAAAAAGAGAAGGGGAAGTAAGVGVTAGAAGAGVSATTIGVIAGAAAGGTLTAVKATQSGSDTTSPSTSDPTSATGHWVGSISGCGLTLDLTQSGTGVGGNGVITGSCGFSGSSAVTGTADSGTISFTMTLLTFSGGIPLSISTLTVSGVFAATTLNMSGSVDRQIWKDFNADSIPQCPAECTPDTVSSVTVSANRRS